MNYYNNYLKSFNKCKDLQTEDEAIDEREFYDIIEQIESEFDYLHMRAEKHPDYNFYPTPKVPASMELDKLEKLVKEIKSYIKKSKPFDDDEELDHMFPNRHDADFDGDSMNYDSIFGSD